MAMRKYKTFAAFEVHWILSDEIDGQRYKEDKILGTFKKRKAAQIFLDKFRNDPLYEGEIFYIQGVGNAAMV